MNDFARAAHCYAEHSWLVLPLEPRTRNLSAASSGTACTKQR